VEKYKDEVRQTLGLGLPARRATRVDPIIVCGPYERGDQRRTEICGDKVGGSAARESYAHERSEDVSVDSSGQGFMTSD